MSLQITYECAQLSQLAYESGHIAKVGGEALGAQHIYPFSVATTQGVIAEFADYVIIAFRGTTLEDISTDLWVRRVRGPAGYVHSGFLGYSNRAIKHLRSALGVMCSVVGFKPVYFTGHSLGGAAAQLAALSLGPASPEPIRNQIQGVITFGSPRVGDIEFSQRLDEMVHHQRWVNANDGVAYIPWMLGTYVHSGELNYITTDRQVWRNPNPLAVFLDRWGWFKRGVLHWASDKIKDHRLQRYITVIARDYRAEREQKSTPDNVRLPAGKGCQGRRLFSGWSTKI